jgi:ferric-dicitrate binding protein FerR (iron transport regulator)
VLSAWREGKFVIRDQRLEDIFKEVSRWYDVEFRFENEKFKDYRYTGNIKKSTTAQHILKMLKLTTHFNYRIIEKPTEPDVIIIY